MEVATLSVIGAIIGISLGIGLAKLVSVFTPLPASVAPWSIGAAVIVGAGVGIMAGFYPATRLRAWIPSSRSSGSDRHASLVPDPDLHRRRRYRVGRHPL